MLYQPEGKEIQDYGHGSKLCSIWRCGVCRLYSGSLRPLLNSSFPHLPTPQPSTLLHRQEEREGACPGARGTFISLEPPQTLCPGDEGTERVCQGDGRQHIPGPGLCLPSCLATRPPITLEQISKRPLSLTDTGIFWKSAAVDIPTCCYDGNGWPYSCEVHPPPTTLHGDPSCKTPGASYLLVQQFQGHRAGHRVRWEGLRPACDRAIPLHSPWEASGGGGAEIWSQPLPSSQKGWGAMGHE